VKCHPWGHFLGLAGHCKYISAKVNSLQVYLMKRIYFKNV
jgi:hypothetical protein